MCLLYECMCVNTYICHKPISHSTYRFITHFKAETSPIFPKGGRVYNNSVSLKINEPQTSCSLFRKISEKTRKFILGIHLPFVNFGGE